MATVFLPNASTESGKRDGPAESRSTSAGSHQSAEPSQQMPYAASSLLSGLPEYDYPVPVVVRNTFIDAQVGRPLSLDEFFEERRIHSCPMATPKAKEEVAREDTATPEPMPLRRAITTGTEAFTATLNAITGYWAGSQEEAVTFPVQNYQNYTMPQEVPRVLRLSEALPGPMLGSNELPTAGSAGHYTGNCKPCAFFYTKGCQNGPQCQFCHLCSPDEKRKRQKEKQVAFRDVRRQRRQVRL